MSSVLCVFYFFLFISCNDICLRSFFGFHPFSLQHMYPLHRPYTGSFWESHLSDSFQISHSLDSSDHRPLSHQTHLSCAHFGTLSLYTLHELFVVPLITPPSPHLLGIPPDSTPVSSFCLLQFSHPRISKQKLRVSLPFGYLRKVVSFLKYT